MSAFEWKEHPYKSGPDPLQDENFWSIGCLLWELMKSEMWHFQQALSGFSVSLWEKHDTGGNWGGFNSHHPYSHPKCRNHDILKLEDTYYHLVPCLLFIHEEAENRSNWVTEIKLRCIDFQNRNLIHHTPFVTWGGLGRDYLRLGENISFPCMI